MQLPEPPYNGKRNIEDVSIFTGAFVFESAATLQYLTMGSLGLCLRFSLIAFSVSLPFLATLIFIKRAERDMEKAFGTVTNEVAYALALLGFAVGIIFLFFHFPKPIGWIFFSSFGLALFAFIRFASWRRKKESNHLDR